ncbi:hypothetical protein ACTHGU_07965 [Chitinophagaceae bacterium MMS25-I14]
MQYSFKTIRLRTFVILLLIIGLHAGLLSYAQTRKSPPKKAAPATDSAARARQHMLDSTRLAQKKALDSIKTVRTHSTDSLKKARKHTIDSLAAIRKYRESKKYKDSVSNARLSKVNALRKSQKQHFDSLKATRQKQTDSIVSVRKHATDSLKAGQKKRTEKLAAIRKYKESKRFRDSVSVSRQLHMDSMRAVRKKFTDSAFASRKHIMDSSKQARKVYFDNLTAVRKKAADSLKAVRKVKADSLAKAKDARAKQQKVNEKKKEDKAKLALELKIKKKHEAWNNEKMLKKKWSLPRQAIQNTFTRYNYYFNANRKMDEALANMQRMAKSNNYDSLIELFPFNPDRDSAALSSDMDSIIQKVSLGVQIHDPRTKWGDDLYLLLGQAYYYKGNYENATASFRYAISILDRFKKKKTARPVSSKSREEPSIVEDEKKSMLDFLKHQTVHNESLLWLARVYTQSGHEGEAESVLDLLSADKKFPESLKGQLAVEEAFLTLKQHNVHTASEQLGIVSNDNNVEHWLRLRAAYLNGQLLQRQGNYNAAAESFRKVIDLQPKIDMDFYARKYLAYNIMYGGGDQKDAIASLKKLLNDGKYTPYYDQVYFVLGRLAANTGNTQDAITYLSKSISTPKASKKQKAVSFASLGDVYYSVHQYEAAKKAYDSASYLASHAPNDPLIAQAVRRSKALDEITGPVHTIYTEDSLLVLSGLSEKEQRNAARKYIRHAEQLRADSIFKAENAGVNAVATTDPSQNDNNYTNWYYTNPSLMQQGYNEFKRKWGNRALTDNWSRMSSVSLSGSTAANTTTPDTTTAAAPAANPNGGQIAYDENGIPTEESLLSFIPNTADKQNKARLRIQRAYIDLANAYVRQLEDFPQALQTLDSLDSKYPAHEHKAQDYYLRYLVALKQNKLPLAQEYSSKLQKEYPESQYASLVRPTEDNPNGNTQVTVAAYYDQTYDLLNQRQFTEVITRAKNGRVQYNDVRYKSKFIILEASAQAAVENYAAAEALIVDLVKDNPNDSLRPWAEKVLDYITKNKPKQPAAAPAQGANSNNLGEGPVHPLPPGTPTSQPQPATNGTNTPAPQPTASNPAGQPATPGAPATVAPANIPATYTYKPQEEHYFVFAFKQMDNKAMGVKAALTDMDNMKFSTLNLSANLEMLQGQQGLVITRSFQNASQANIYLNTFKGNPQITREYTSASDYDVFIISAKNLLKLQADKSLADYLQFYRKQYK